MTTTTTGETTWSVDCAACGQHYDQGRGDAMGRGPTMCGACGSRRVRVVQHLTVFDNRDVCMEDDHDHIDRREAWCCVNPHEHEWNEDDYCNVCGADGRS